MKIRLGYACISETIKENFKTYTYTRYKQEKNKEKLESIISSNLFHLKELLIYNNKNNIHFFRITSNLIPLATIEDVVIDYTKWKREYRQITQEIKKKSMRVDFHPSEYCVLNSTKQEVINQSIKILKYHYHLLKDLKIKNPLLVLHIGSKEFGKEKSLTRFINTYQKLPEEIKQVIAIENDDKSFNIEDCIELSEKISIPVILDYHHHQCNPSTHTLEELLPKIMSTWHTTPKVHFSSPKSKRKKEYRSHHDYIDVEEFIKFLKILKQQNIDIDIMLEAKKKEEALFRLVRELKYKLDLDFVDETSFML